MKKTTDMAELLAEGKKSFDKCKDADAENREEGLNDLRFARLGDQWPSDVKAQREKERRPVLTINRMQSFIRQVVNDARQNKPQIKVRAVDGSGDVKTADVINGLIRNIEYSSNADVAYDTAAENAASCGIGYIRVGMDYAFDDVFDMDLQIERVLNPFSVFGDPFSTAADGSDWNVAFVIDRISKDEYKKRYGDSDDIDCDFDGSAWLDAGTEWLNEDGVLIAEWWTRKEVDRELALLSDGRVVSFDDIETDPDLSIAVQSGVITIKQTRMTKSHEVKQRIMSGVNILEENDWPGRYIPIVPVYGDEFAVEGKRYYRSLINQAKDAQRMLNYWRTTATELVALAPRVPWIGRKGTFDSDIERWATANTESHAFLEFDREPPARQPLDSGIAAGALQEALNASDDMKSIVGIYDASLGARSNETSGRAILARQREGDVATFHFIDNLSRGIRHVGRILIDLIPHIYTGPRMIRVIGEDGNQDGVKINQPTPATDDEGRALIGPNGQAIMAIHDLTAGKYDLSVSSGPSFTTRREEAAAQMTELVRAFPQAAPFVADIMAKNFDWPGADEIAKRFEAMNPANQQKGLPPQVQQMMQEGQQLIAQLKAENEKLKAKHDIETFDAQTRRKKVDAEIMGDQIQTGVNLYEAIKPQPIPTGQG